VTKEKNKGPLSVSERNKRIHRYLVKKISRSLQKKFRYRLRHERAVKRLRIQGKFVTKEQAFEILGLTADQLLGNDLIQGLLTQHSDN
jgi:hypothetical protein